MRVLYLGSEGCKRGMGWAMTRKGTGVVVFGLSEGCTGCFSAGRGSIRCHLRPLSLEWKGRWCWFLAGAVLCGIRDCTCRPMAPSIPVEENTIPTEMIVSGFAMAEVGVKCVAKVFARLRKSAENKSSTPNTNINLEIANKS